MTHKHAPRRGFSLIEIMVVIAIVSILMAISAGAFVRYFVNARQRSTEAMLTIVDDAIAQRYESYWNKVDPPTRARHAVLAGLAGPYVTNEPQAVRLRRARLIAKLEGMRGDFPQQFADFLPGTSGGLASSTDVATYADNIAAVASRARTAIEAEYRRLTFEKNPTGVPNNGRRYVPTDSTTFTQIAPHDHQTESAACLYLILKVTSAEGRAFDMGSIPPSFIRDTDEDGVPEIVDAWGTPVRFYRWPSDLLQHFATVSGQLGGGLNVLNANNSNNQNNLDPEKLLYTAAWTASTASQIFEQNPNQTTLGMGNFFWVSDHVPYATTPPPTSRTTFSYPIYPVIVSAGADAVQLSREDRWQAFGLVWTDDLSAAPVPSGPITYSWPPFPPNSGGTVPLRTRSGQISEEAPFGSSYPGAGMHTDNIFSRVIVAGREAR
jgi:prepilin-type N-terminal cleavage/methylation domain-containing protein